MADEIINARVKQKVDTEENWMANPLILLEGESAFVVTEDNEGVNFKIGDGTKTFSELPYWINYYSNVISHKLIRLDNVSVPQNIPSIFNENTNLYDIVIANIGGGDVTLKIGTTEGGNEIGKYNLVSGNNVLDIKYMFDSPETLYLSGFDGNALSIIIIYFNYNENPIIPPSGGGSTPFRWPKGAVGMFVPVGTGHLEASFDMITGQGVSGSPYENCQICDSLNAVLNMEDSYPIGYKTGVTIGSLVGANGYKLTQANIPQHRFFTVVNSTIESSGFPPITTDVNSMVRSYIKTSGGGKESYILGGQNSVPSLSPTNSYGLLDNTPVDTRPKSRYLIYFLATTD